MRGFALVHLGNPIHREEFRKVVKQIARDLEIEIKLGDEICEPGSIFELITELIKDSDFIIADLTCKSSHILFELGYAWACNKRIILTQLKSESEDPSYFSDYQLFLYYETYPELTERLSTEILRIIEELREKLSYTVFVSYSLRDSKLYNVKALSDSLEQYDDIQEVVYCEEDTIDDFVEYMDEYIGKCDVVLLFCSTNASNSRFVKTEWRAAFSMNKTIVPIYKDVEHIPPLLRAIVGIEYTDITSTVEAVHQIILKKLKGKRDD